MQTQNKVQDPNRHCTGCTYWRWFSGRGSNAINACHYILDTGKMRGCSVESCTKKVLLKGATI